MKGKVPKKRWFTDEIKQFLLSSQTLKDWAPYPCEYRVNKIYEKFGVKIHHRTLNYFYKEHNIRFKKP